MTQPLPTLRQRTFRAMFRVGVAATLLATAGLMAVGYVSTRSMTIDTYRYATQTAASNLPLYPDYLRNFQAPDGMLRMCSYDAHNQLMEKWQRPDAAGGCPHLLVRQGIFATAFFVTISQAITINGEYMGMAYSEGELDALNIWLMRAGILLSTLLTICFAVCWASAYWSVKNIAPSFAAISKQIECLKNNNSKMCEIFSHPPTQEMSDMARDIMQLRSHLEDSTMPKEAVVNLKSWYWEVLSGLLSGLRQQLDADSPLLENLSDYALLVQTERGDILPAERSFDIVHLMERSLDHAQISHPVSVQVNVTASLQPNMPRQWLGQPEILEALLKHLLLIGLRRIRSGFVSLKLEVADDSHLRIVLEDSGTKVQQWQLQQWLAPSREETPAVEITDDISWLLASRLYRRLKGSITGKSGSEGGLILEGSIPLLVDLSKQITAPAPQPVVSLHKTPPLVLVVEKDLDNRNKFIEQLGQAGCSVFAVSNHGQAVEWAALLPFSVLILNVSLSDATDNVIRYLSHMRDDGALSDIPWWAVIARHSFIEFDYWQKRGISELLLKPLDLEALRERINHLQPLDANFYEAHNENVRHDFSPNILESLPQLNNMLSIQIEEILPHIEGLAKGKITPEMMHQAHALRSAALNLGYFRLAALMGQVEYLKTVGVASFPQQNWHIVAQCLRDSHFNSLPAVTLLHHIVNSNQD